MTTYQELVNQEGTIYNKTTGKGYATPADLASDLGIQPHQIEWAKIASGQITPSQVSTPSQNIPSTPVTPSETPVVTNNLIRYQGSPDVYEVMGDGSQRYISYDEFTSNPNFKWENVQDVIKKEPFNKSDVTDVDTYQPDILSKGGIEAPVITPNELFREIGGYKVYKVNPENKTLDWLDMPAEQFTATYGPDAWSKINEVTNIQTIMDAYSVSGDIGIATSEYASFIAPYKQIIDQVESIRTQSSDAVTKLEKQLEDKLAEVAAARKNIRDDPEVTDAQKELKEVELDIVEMEGAADLALQEATTRLESTKFIQGAQAQIQNFYDIKLKTLYAKRAVFQGDYSLAVDLAKQAIESDLAQKELELSILATGLDNARGKLTSAEEMKLTTMMNQIQLTMDAINTTKTEKDNRANAYIKYLQSFPGASTVITPDMSEIDMAKAMSQSGLMVPKTGGGLTPYQTLQTRNQIEDNMRINPAIKTYTDLVDFGVVEVIEQFNSGKSDSISDTILMRTLAKITDPTTGVREGEYATFESAQGALGRIMVIPKGWLGKGRLTDTGRQAMIREIESRFAGREKEYQNQYNYYQNQAAQSGVTLPPPYSTITTQDTTSYDLDYTIQLHKNDYKTREELIDAIASTGLDRNTVAARVYNLIPDVRTTKDVGTTKDEKKTSSSNQIGDIFKDYKSPTVGDIMNLFK